MPGRDRTGPQGQGPLTGWGEGECGRGRGMDQGTRASGGQGRRGICRRDRLRGQGRGRGGRRGPN